MRALAVATAALAAASSAIAASDAAAAFPAREAPFAGFPTSSAPLSSVSALLGVLGAVRSGDDADAAPPPQPQWPTEWSATLVLQNTTSNVTSAADYSFSITHNSTVYSPEVQGIIFDQYSYYWLEKTLIVSAIQGQPLSCSESPLSGSPTYPPVQYFTYNGTINANGQTCWLWVLESEGMAYITQRTKQQQPVALIEASTGIITIFSGFESFAPPMQWPAGYWMVPDPCPSTLEAEAEPAGASLRGAAA